ncbi:MAG: phytanoyl-CoA dioxygenase family protein [Candidatus Poribacteria bacterium]|nr:phytanoyl-CoA dioxygenase family protein [Candidatus Poribacteria bacterium]MDE0503401.1 phytanoyl-CoA dioxygenase family protein [Candidatus Poribacteria bacterium]
MTPEIAIQTREQMTRDGYCVIDDVLTEDFLNQLREETERLIEGHDPSPDIRYQGQHVTVRGTDNTIIQKLLDWSPSRSALEQLGFGDFISSGGVIILTKDPGEPPLYWHQDWMRWNDPISCSPWPQTIFVSYYLSDTNIENGCLKVIPGTHLRRIPLHDQLVPAHEQGARFVEENHPIMFSDHPDEVNVCVSAGSLVLADARILHSARRNLTDDRRTLVLAWHSRPTCTVPEYWDSEIPEVIRNRDANQDYSGSRIPGRFLL